MGWGVASDEANFGGAMILAETFKFSLTNSPTTNVSWMDNRKGNMGPLGFNELPHCLIRKLLGTGVTRKPIGQTGFPCHVASR